MIHQLKKKIADIEKEGVDDLPEDQEEKLTDLKERLFNKVEDN